MCYVVYMHIFIPKHLWKSNWMILIQNNITFELLTSSKNCCKWSGSFFFFFLKKESLSCVPLFATPWSLPGSSVHGISQVRILKWVAISFSRGSSRPRDGTRVSCIAGRFFTIWATREDLFNRGECLLNTYSVPNLKLTIWHILLLTIALSKQVSRS